MKDAIANLPGAIMANKICLWFCLGCAVWESEAIKKIYARQSHRQSGPLVPFDFSHPQWQLHHVVRYGSKSSRFHDVRARPAIDEVTSRPSTAFDLKLAAGTLAYRTS